MSNERKRANAIIAICARIGDQFKINESITFEEIDWKGDDFVSIGRLCPNISSITFDDTLAPSRVAVLSRRYFFSIHLAV